MRQRYVGLILLVLIGCATERTSREGEITTSPATPAMLPDRWDQASDSLGNTLPQTCRRNLAALVAPGQVQVIRMSPADMERALGRPAYGLTFSFGVSGDEVIWINSDIVPGTWFYYDIERHEYCHIAEFGGMAWHT